MWGRGDRAAGSPGDRRSSPPPCGFCRKSVGCPGRFPFSLSAGAHSKFLLQFQQWGSMIILLALYLEKCFSHQTHREEASQRRDHSKWTCCGPVPSCPAQGSPASLKPLPHARMNLSCPLLSGPLASAQPRATSQRPAAASPWKM